MSTTAPPLSRGQNVRLILILGALQALGPFSIDMYLPGLPAVARDLRVDEGAAQFTLSVFVIGLAVGQAIYGPVTDKYGRKGPLLFGVSLFVVASVLCALAPSITLLIAARFVQALGASATGVITVAVVRDLWSGRDAADRFSLLLLVMGVAPILAPMVGGLILTRTTWHALFWILAGIGVLCLLAVLTLRETSSAQDRSGVRLRDAAGTYAALLRNAPFMAYALAGAFATGALFAYVSGSSFVYIENLGVSPGLFGALFGLNALGLIASAQVNRLAIRRWGLHAVAAAANATTVLFAVLLVLLVSTGHTGVVPLTALLFGLLATLGFTFPNTTTLALEQVRSRMGSASALRGTLQFGLAGLTGSLVGVLSDGTALPMVAVIAVCAASAGLLLVLARHLTVTPAK